MQAYTAGNIPYLKYTLKVYKHTIQHVRPSRLIAIFIKSYPTFKIYKYTRKTIHHTLQIYRYTHQAVYQTVYKMIQYTRQSRFTIIHGRHSRFTDMHSIQYIQIYNYTRKTLQIYRYTY